MTAPEVRVVRDWHEALNAGDADLLVALSHPDVEVGGPRGTGRGAQLLREWVARSGVRIEPRRIFHRAGTVVVEGDASWRDAGTGQTTGEQTVGSVFAFRDGRVTRVVRHPDLASALLAAGMDESNEARPDG
ncbi:nuclear transport factor 2 family protein [Rubrobacter marinus]|uniref:nuclear transport factor 2 family protein n=1 Tax=Rubrobacter marinus TaxID=2653852 RepID=UPI001409A040|nr:nuclear transport factor 2 family protein [Rubrobacter marinus]